MWEGNHGCERGGSDGAAYLRENEKNLVLR